MIVTNEINYHDEDILCRGFIAYDQKTPSLAPAVIIAHDWGGRGNGACDKAIELAQLGYIGFAIDMYGEAQLPSDKVAKRALMAPLINNRQKLVQRIYAAFTALSQLPQVDKGKIAAIGYCFGGLCVLDLARFGTDVKGVVSFHGLLSAPEEDTYKPIKAKILILHGYDDPLVKPDQVTQFASEMNTRKADWQVHMYGLVQHSFTDPRANDDEMGLHYNAQADRRSWQAAIDFLKEIL